MERAQIEALIPHRPPFLLVDRMIESVPGRYSVGLKRVCDDGCCLLADCNGKPVMPGALVLEAMAQVGAVAVLSLPEYRGQTTLLAGIENARFYRNVSPGEEIRMEVEIVKLRKKAGKRRCRAMVGEEIVAEADLLFVLSDTSAMKREVD